MGRRLRRLPAGGGFAAGAYPGRPLELLYSARNVADYEVRWDDLRALPWLPLTEAVAGRALDIQRR